MVLMEEEYHVMLILKIHSAEGIDTQTTDPKGDKRIYCALGWVNHLKEFRTSRTEGLPDPEWNTMFRIPLGRLSPGGFGYLNLEVLRTGSKLDPGTSTGIALVGWTQIPLPKDINRKKCGRFGLTAPKGAGYITEGHITINMEIKRVDDINYFRH